MEEWSMVLSEVVDPGGRICEAVQCSRTAMELWSHCLLVVGVPAQLIY